MSALLGAQELRDIALRFLKIEKRTERTKEIEFHKHYGSSSFTIASMWFDLCHTEIESAKLSLKEKQCGLKMFLLAPFFSMVAHKKRTHDWFSF